MSHFLFMGLVLGLSAGLAPGPLLTLVVSETLRHHVGAGIRVALAPLISDLPIVLVSVGILSTMADFEAVLGGDFSGGGRGGVPYGDSRDKNPGSGDRTGDGGS